MRFFVSIFRLPLFAQEHLMTGQFRLGSALEKVLIWNIQIGYNSWLKVCKLI